MHGMAFHVVEVYALSFIMGYMCAESIRDHKASNKRKNDSNKQANNNNIHKN